MNGTDGTFYLRSHNVSEHIENGEFIFKLIEGVVQEIGEENVIQVITDSAWNMKNVGKQLMEKHKVMWWTPCAAHVIDLLLEDIGKMGKFEVTIEQAKQVINFIYAHSIVLAMMRKLTMKVPVPFHTILLNCIGLYMLLLMS